MPALVFAIIPFHQVVNDRNRSAKAGQSAGLLGSLKRAREHVLELYRTHSEDQPARLVLAMGRERDVGLSRVASRKRPLGLNMPNQI
jgi:hypothetical protein